MFNSPPTYVYTWKLEILVISLQLLLRHPSKCKNYTIHFHFLRYTCIYPIHLNSQVKGEAENSLKGLLYLENSFALLCFKATSKFPQHVFYSRDLQPIIRYVLLQILTDSRLYYSLLSVKVQLKVQTSILEISKNKKK